MTALKKYLHAILLRYPSAILGMVIILFLLAVSVYALVTIPYSEAVRLWRGGEDVWYQNPKYAPLPGITIFQTRKNRFRLSVNTTDGSMSKTTTPSSDPEHFQCGYDLLV